MPWGLGFNMKDLGGIGQQKSVLHVLGLALPTTQP